MKLGTNQHWKRLDDDGRVLAVYRRRKVDGLLRMERYTFRGEWSEAPDDFFTPIEDPDFEEISAAEAADLLPVVRARAIPQ